MEVASCTQSYRTQLIRVWRGLATYTRVRTTAEVPNPSHEPTMYNNSYCSSAAVVVVPFLFFLFFFKSSGGWVKIKLKLPHYHVPDKHVVFRFNPS